MLRQPTLCCLMLGEYFSGANDYFIRQSRKFRDFNSITFIGRAGFDFAEEDYASAGFLYGYMVVLYAAELLGQFGQLEIVSGEESFGMDAGVQVFDSGPGDGHAVVGGGAASDFIEKDERARRGGVKDGSGVRPFDHECAESPGQLAASPAARKHTVASPAP